ncbi:hypothetical protein PGTUg99_031853 [Puccinia graminis f. sp. tritici]|uniref:Uncharacterized protein n=1 Tax=Puccinia graminis f. sp. tritici TaxID=56615 RepID=A0A5B0MZK7_PUCGR|nr:hypothetical protein PGTUg99_031853 [Puccinia graminis f. sp. tritici]
MNSIKLAIALIISTAFGLVTASNVIDFYTVEWRSFGCGRSEVPLCIVTRYKKPNDRSSGPDFYILDDAVRVKPGSYNCGMTTAKCCGTNLDYQAIQTRNSHFMKDTTDRFCPISPHYVDPPKKPRTRQ